ncbi:MAG TPA: NADH-quinone oxidoreductase subunit J [Tepidisphaeraceae bacterium]|nr:NADH-quinone oxidoreductase subunit J [Tepidisphaeraceae bacterium]
MPALASTFFGSLPLAAAILSPVMVLVLCVLAGVGTVLLLPSRREKSIQMIGGVLVLAALLIAVAILVRQGGQGTGDLYFWIFSAIAILSAIRVISHEKPVYAALYFVLTVVASAGLFVLLWAEFMAAALILIYAGAILVTYVFVIMLAQQAQSAGTETVSAEYDRTSREPILASAVGFLLMGLLLFVIFDRGQGLPPAASTPASAASLQELSKYLFSSQIISLELAGVILTLAMIGAVVIARRRVTAEPVMHGDVLSAKAPAGQMITTTALPTGVDDNPHTIPIEGTENPTAKADPEQ